MNALITIEPLGVYSTKIIEQAIGKTLWETIAPRLPRLCQGRVLGEDVINVLREISKRDLANRTYPKPSHRAGKASIKRINTPKKGVDHATDADPRLRRISINS